MKIYGEILFTFFQTLLFLWFVKQSFAKCVMFQECNFHIQQGSTECFMKVIILKHLNSGFIPALDILI